MLTVSEGTAWEADMASTTAPGAAGGDRFVGHIVLDVPAKHPTLSFTQIAQALATIVQASEPRFAVGIFGGWGSGKSTLMDEIERLVAENGQAVVVRFNAWRYEREPHLVVPLLDTIRSRLSEWADDHPADTHAEQVKSIARRIGRVVRALVRATSVELGVPGGPSISVDPGKALDEMGSATSDAASSPQSLYFAAFQELTAAFAEVQTAGLSRLIVFVDDLDRCLPERALTVLESMKLFFDMPGFVFVVGLDERVVQSAVRTRFAARSTGEEASVDRQIELEYLKKMFQVPYTLPAMVPGQLNDLLAWLDQYGHLSEIQRRDLGSRVRRYLRYVATEGRINPREVKRYINAYTLHRMIRPDLSPDTVLALQTLDFRVDWEQLYEEAVLAEPDVFVEALRRYRGGDDHAFEDVWPELGVLPLDLSDFLRSDEASVLEVPNLERYVSFLETTRSTQGWVKDALRDVGLLRQQIRQVRPPFSFGSSDARVIVEQLKDVLGRLGSYREASSDSVQRLDVPLVKLQAHVDLLAPSSMPTPTSASEEDLERWHTEAAAHIDGLQQELRFIRRSSAFGPK
jgi:hypothetical protein